MRGLVAASLIAALAVLPGCGGSRQDANEPEGTFTLSVLKASFPAQQSMAQQSRMRLQIRNTDDRTLPNVAVTIETDPGVKGAAPAAFGQASPDTRLASADQPIWIVDRPPEGGESAYTNTWVLGPLSPGATKDVEWRLTAVRAGTYKIHYAVSPGLNGKARIANGQKNTGTFDVTISSEPVPARVNGKGQVVRDESASGG